MAEKAEREGRRELVSIYDRLSRVCVLLQSLGPAVTADQAGVIIGAWKKDGDSWVSVAVGSRLHEELLIWADHPISLAENGLDCMKRLKKNKQKNPWIAKREIKVKVQMFAKARDQDCPEERKDLNRSLSAPSPMLHRHSVPWPTTLETGPEAGHRPQKHPQHSEGTDCVSPAVQKLSGERHLPQRSRLPSSWAYARPRLNESTVLSNGGYSFAAVKGSFPIGTGVSVNPKNLVLPLNSSASIRFHAVDKAVDVQDQSGRDGPRDRFPESGL
ncbi:hypothetical protein E5288_WYG003215 [Bos mutus]|uniref:Uncharacterized protein n=1 Tax=Bos mutus TaxID=72004 RepID=A0A6B0R926_9CETA|nr:hypothetical protein [Bos mutus]